MATTKLRFVNEFVDRHGRLRRYFRRPGCKAIPLPGLPGSTEFNGAYSAALANAPPIEIGASRTVSGTISALIVAYYNSAAAGATHYCRSMTAPMRCIRLSRI
jgi:hypothetical protein